MDFVASGGQPTCRLFTTPGDQFSFDDFVVIREYTVVLLDSKLLSQLAAQPSCWFDICLSISV